MYKPSQSQTPISKPKLIRVATSSGSLAVLLKGQLAYLNQYFQVLAVADPYPDLSKVNQQEGIPTYGVPMQRKISPFRDLMSLWLLYRFFKREKPTIVHSITPKAGLLSMLASKIAGVPVRIHTFTGLVFPTSTGFKKHLLIWMDRLTCSASTHIFPEGEGVKRDLVTYKITKKPLQVIANGNVNGIDLDYFSPQKTSDADSFQLREQWNIPKTDFVFLFIGRIGLEKGVSELVSAFTRIHQRFPDTSLLLVGNYNRNQDPLSNEVETLIQEHPKIVSSGWQSDVRPFLELGQVLVLPSYREGFPNVVLQAGAMGKFSIVTNINGSNEIIKEGENGYIIPPKDSDALEKVMKKCLESPDQFWKVNDDIRFKIKKNYDRRLVWKALLDAYYTSLETKYYNKAQQDQPITNK